MRLKLLIGVVIVVGLPYMFACCLYLFVISGMGGPLPSAEYIKHTRRPIASTVLAIDGSVFGKLYQENRSEVKLEECPQHLLDALIATEDVRFYAHRGVDYRSLGRVFIKGFLLLSPSAGGGSTLSQQLAKNLFPRKRYTFLSAGVHKFREVIIARRIEKIYTKDQILEQYLNTVSFGEHAYGIGTASRRFFDKIPEQLTPEESAVLVGMLKAPSYYSPRRFPDRALSRRNVVLSQMAKYGMIESLVHDSLQSLPLELRYTPESRESELSGYFLSYIQTQAQQTLDDLQNGPSFSKNVLTDGLTIHTTIDPVLQRHAELAVSRQIPGIQKRFDREWGSRADWETSEWITQQVRNLPVYKQLTADGLRDAEAVSRLQEKKDLTVFSWDSSSQERKMSVIDSLKYYKRILQTGLLAMNPETGYISAWIGGIHHRYFPYDHIFAQRQAGSTFKPLVYTAAMEGGIDDCTYYNNTRQVFEDYENWSPGNANGVYGGCYSFRGALVHSVNTIAVQVLQDAGIQNVIDVARRMGIRSSIPHVPSIALGTPTMQLDELTTAYCAFVNGGKQVRPVSILKITDRDGSILYEYFPTQTLRAISDSVATAMLDILQQAVDTGTARALRSSFGLNIPLAGKTGTTQDNTDGWFIGMTPRLVAGVWVGADDARVHFKSLSTGQGASTAMRVYGQFMQNILRDRTYTRWKSEGFSTPAVVPEDCPLYSDLTAEEMEWFRDLARTGTYPPNSLVKIIESIFSSRDLTFEEEERRVLIQLQKKLDRAVVRMQRQKKSAREIRQTLDEIRKEHYAKIDELKRKYGK